MIWAHPRLSGSTEVFLIWRISQRWIETVQVVGQCAEVAGDNLTPPHGRLFAAKAQDSVFFAISEFEIIRNLLVSSTRPVD